MIKQNKYGGYVEVGGTAYWILFILVYIILIGFDVFIITDTFKNENKIKLLSSYIKDKESELEKLNEATDKAMLRQNPNFLKFKMRHDGGFIVPTDLEKRRQEFKDSPNKFKRRAF